MADFTLVIQDAVHNQTVGNIVLIVPFARTSNIAIGFEYLDYDAVRTSTIALMVEYIIPPPRILGPAIQNH